MAVPIRQTHGKIITGFDDVTGFADNLLGRKDAGDPASKKPIGTPNSARFVLI